jgi:hypothetical protein
MSDQTIGLSVRSLGVDTSDETTLFPGNVTSLGKQVGALSPAGRTTCQQTAEH